MLTAMRKSVNSLTAKILLGLLIISFAVWGVADAFNGRASSIVATVGDEEVESRDYARALNNYLTTLRQQIGSAVSLEDARRMGADDLILSQLTTRAALNAEARSLGLAASDLSVAQEIRSIPQFQDSFGEFDRELYRRAINFQRLNEREFEEQIRGDLSREALLESIGVGASAPRALAEALYQRRNEQRSVRYIELSGAEMDDPGEPTDGQIAAFHTDNPAPFTAPETRAVTILAMTEQSIADAAAKDITAERLREVYEAEIDRFRTPERRRVDQILFDDEDAARTALAEVRAGQPFAQVAEASGQDVATTTLGLVRRGDLPDALDAPAFAMTETGLAGPIETAFGYAILSVREIRPEITRPFEDVEQELRRDLAMEEAFRRLPELSVDVEDRIAGGAPLADAAPANGAILLDLEAIDEVGRDAEGQRIAGLPPIAELLPTIFATEPGADPRLIEADEGGYFAISVANITPATLRSLETVRDEVIAAWKSAQRAEALKATAADLRAALEKGEALEDLATAQGVEVQTPDPIRRDGGFASLTAALRTAIFAAETGAALDGPARGDEGHLIIVLDDVVAADADEDLAAIDAEVERYAAALANDLIQTFSQAAVAERPVAVNRQVMDQALNQMGGAF